MNNAIKNINPNYFYDSVTSGSVALNSIKVLSVLGITVVVSVNSLVVILN